MALSGLNVEHPPLAVSLFEAKGVSLVCFRALRLFAVGRKLKRSLEAAESIYAARLVFIGHFLSGICADGDFCTIIRDICR